MGWPIPITRPWSLIGETQRPIIRPRSPIHFYEAVIDIFRMEDLVLCSGKTGTGDTQYVCTPYGGELHCDVSNEGITLKTLFVFCSQHLDTGSRDKTTCCTAENHLPSTAEFGRSCSNPGWTSRGLSETCKIMYYLTIPKWHLGQRKHRNHGSQKTALGCLHIRFFLIISSIYI